jgi:ribosomal protein L2
VLPLGEIPEGTAICNVEKRPNDGGKFVRSSGTFATVFGHTPSGTVIKLPSGKKVVLDNRCRATIGVVAGSGRVEKPFLKAGKKYHLMVSKGRVWPRTRGVAMIAADHPFGGGRHRGVRRVSAVKRIAPPGQKVGLIAPKRTGRRRGGRRRE